MKTLEEFQLIKEFLGGQGLKPTVAMISVSQAEWQDLVYLARCWRTERDEKIRQHEEELANLSEEELALRDKQAREEALLENDRILFHSAGYDPEKKNV
jgi:hypothetical protein